MTDLVTISEANDEAIEKERMKSMSLEELSKHIGAVILQQTMTHIEFQKRIKRLTDELDRRTSH